jgi:hypothetical protein
VGTVAGGVSSAGSAPPPISRGWSATSISTGSAAGVGTVAGGVSSAGSAPPPISRGWSGAP